MSELIYEEQSQSLNRWQRAGKVAVGALLVATPVAAGLAAIAHAPASHVEIAGQDIEVKPVIGQDHTQIADGAVLRPEHYEVPLLHKSVGLDVNANWNNILHQLQNKHSRDAFTQLANDPEPEIARIQSTADNYLLKWGLGVAGGVAAIELLGLGAVQLTRKTIKGEPDTGQASMNKIVRPWAYGSAAVLLSGAVLVNTIGMNAYTHDDHQTVVGSPELASGKLGKNTQLVGGLGDAAPYVQSLLEVNNPFYDKVSKNLAEAIAQRPELQTTKDEQLFFTADDFQGNQGMARIYGESISLTNAETSIYLGDWTDLGKLFETPIIDAYMYRAGDTESYATEGLHDTDEIIQTEQDRGLIMADDKTKVINGFRVLLLNDPRISGIGNLNGVDSLRDPDVDIDTFVDNAVQEIEANQPQIMFIHDNKLAKQILDSLAANAIQPPVLIVDGRNYQYVGMRNYGTADTTDAVEYTLGSGGAHFNTKASTDTISTQNPGTYSAFKYNAVTKQMDVFAFTVESDSTVVISHSIMSDISIKSMDGIPFSARDNNSGNDTAAKH